MTNSKITTATLGGTVWNDVNHDGIQNDGNVGGIAGVKVILLNSAGKNSGIYTFTDANGNYSFAGLKPGAYSVQFDSSTLSSGAKFTTDHVGKNGNIDSDANYLTGKTGIIHLGAGQTNNSVDAGIIIPTQNNTATINGHVWNDSNTNGLQDAGEGITPGFTVDLLSVDANGAVDGRVVLSSYVDTNGNYSFTGLEPGQYIAQVGGVPAGYGFTQFNQGSDDAIDSDINPVTGRTDVFTLTSGQVNKDIDIGLSNAPGTIKTHVWADNNANGIQDTGESGLAGAQVVVYNGQESPATVLATGVTDSNGDFSINVATGYYSLVVGGVEGYRAATLQNAGTDDTLDSDISTGIVTSQILPTTQSTEWFLVQPNEINSSVDAGFIKDPLVDIGATKGVWLDSNNNGIKDASESGVAGVTVTLSSAGADGQNFTSDDIIYGITVTNTNGDYLFSSVKSFINYRVSFSNIGADKQFTTANAGEILVPRAGYIDVATDSDADINGHTSQSAYGGMISAGLVDIIGTPALTV